MSNQRKTQVITHDNLEYALENAKQAILNKKQYVYIDNNRYAMWPLFFNENNKLPEAEIDSCAASLGIKAFSGIAHTDYQTSLAIQEGLSLLLLMRNENGSWPSHISRVGKENSNMEGVINDTYFALDALMSVNFLSNAPKVDHITDPKTGETLEPFNRRLDIICHSVKWLLDNKVNQGWQYTGTAYLGDDTDRTGLSAYTLPSAHVIIVLSKIMDAIRIQKPKHGIIRQIQASVDDTVSWFCDICNRDGGFGTKWRGESRITNTAKVLLALSTASYSDTLKERVEKTIHKSAKWLCRNYNPIKLTTNDVCEEYSEFIIEGTGENSTPLKRTYLHETCVEPLLVESLSCYWKGYHNRQTSYGLINSKKVLKTIRKATEYLLGLQAQDGPLRGFVSSRRATDNQRYAIYSCSDFICALCSLTNTELDIILERFQKTNNIIKVSVFLTTAIAICLSIFFSYKPVFISAILLVLAPIIKEIITKVVISRIEAALDRVGL